MRRGIAGVLRRSVKIEPGEGRLVGLMMLYSAAVTGGVYTVGYALGEALFLTRLPASDTPYLFIFPAMTIVLALLVYRWTAARVRSDRVAAGSAAVLLCATLIFRLLLASPYGSDFGTLAALFLFVEIAITLLFTQYWTLAAQIFDSRQARRLFGLIAAGGTIANVVAGLVMARLVQRIGVENLLYVMTASLAICSLCPLAIARLPETRLLGVASTPSRTSLGDDLRMVRRIPLLVAIACLTIVLALMINVAIYQYFLALQVSTRFGAGQAARAGARSARWGA